jgi:excisionase family DNA binding protein
MQQDQLAFDVAPDVHSAQPARVTASQTPTERTIITANVAEPNADRAEPFGASSVATVREPLLLTVRDVEVALQLGRTRTYELVRSGAIPVLRVGRAVRVPREALRRWIDEQCTAPHAHP